MQHTHTRPPKTVVGQIEQTEKKLVNVQGGKIRRDIIHQIKIVSLLDSRGKSWICTSLKLGGISLQPVVMLTNEITTGQRGEKS